MTRLAIDTPATGVLRLRLDGPDILNALDTKVKTSLIAELTMASREPSVRAVLLTGTGRAFCAGGDVRAMNDRTPSQTADVLTFSREITERLTSTQKPVVAAVNGIASGAGFNLALACDVVVAHESAWFQQSFTRIGLVPDMGGTYLLARQVGLSRAKELLLTGRRIGSAEARDLGLVAHVWTDDFERRSIEYCAELAQGATRALGLTKVLANRAMDLSLRAAMDQEELAQAVASSTADHRDALETFRSTGSLDAVQFKGE